MKTMRKLLVYVLITVLAVTCVPPMGAYALQTDSQSDDGLLLREYSDFAGKGSTYRTYAVDSDALQHNSGFSDAFIEDGIDISHHNGTVDWNRVKADGVDFAIIRMAYRGYGQEGNIKTDDQAFENLKNARAAGIKVGVYFFSQAITEKEAVEEANYILDLIKGYAVDLPVVMDFEYTAGSEGRLYAADLTNRQRTDICLAFCETVEKAGYNAMVYANKSMLTNSLYAEEIDSKYDIWLAEWSSSASYEGKYSYWQYTSDGSVDGVPSSRVDMNVRYISDPFVITGKTASSLTMEWNPIIAADGYVIYRKTANTDYKIVKQIDNPETSIYKDKNLKTNTKYIYMIRYYKLNASGEQVIYKSGYPVAYSKTALKLNPVTVKGAAVNAGTVKLSWSKEPNADGYVIQKYNFAKGKYETVKTKKAKDGRFYYMYGLKPGTTYKFRVRPYAVVSGVTKYGKYSEPVSIKTSSVLKKPELTATTYSYTSINLKWKKVPGAAGYVIQRYSKDKNKYVTVKTIKNGSTLKYKDTYLNAGLIYNYKIKAYAVNGGKKIYSKPSAMKTAKTGPARVGKVIPSELNVRYGPGTSYKKITTAKKGQKLTITGSTKSWYRVKIKVKGKTRTGYVAKSYVLLLNSK